MPEKQKQPEGRGTELTVVPNRRSVLRSAGLAGAGLVGVGSTSVNVIAAGRTTTFVEATYTHTVDFGEHTAISIPRSQVSIDTQPSYVTPNGHDTLRIRRFADRDTRDYIENSDRLTKISLGPFERYPAQDVGPRPMRRVVVNVLRDSRPVTTYRAVQQYQPPRFDIRDATSGQVAITVGTDSYGVDAGSTTRIPLDSRRMRLHVTTESGRDTTEAATVTPELIVVNHGPMQIEEATASQ